MERVFDTEADDMRNPSRHKDDPLNMAIQSPDIFLRDRLELAYVWLCAQCMFFKDAIFCTLADWEQRGA